MDLGADVGLHGSAEIPSSFKSSDSCGHVQDRALNVDSLTKDTQHPHLKRLWPIGTCHRWCRRGRRALELFDVTTLSSTCPWRVTVIDRTYRHSRTVR